MAAAGPGPPLLPPAPVGPGLRQGDDQIARQMVNFVYAHRRPGDRRGAPGRPRLCGRRPARGAGADGMRCTGVLATHYHADHVGGSIGGWTDRGGGRPARAGRRPHPRPARRGAVGEAVDRREEPTCSSPTTAATSSAVGDVEVELLHTPGHTPGSQCFLVEGRLVSGDTLFLDGCGRTDLPGSDPEAMYESLTTRLARVPDDTVFFPGHQYSPAPSAPLSLVRRTNFVFVPRTAEAVAGDVRSVSRDRTATPEVRSGRRHRRRRRRVVGRAAGRPGAARGRVRGPVGPGGRRASPPLRPAAAVQAGAGRDVAAGSRGWRTGSPRRVPDRAHPGAPRGLARCRRPPGHPRRRLAWWPRTGS